MFDSAETSGKKAPSRPPTPLLSVSGGSGRNMKSAPFLFPVYLLIITLEIRRCRAVPGPVPSGGSAARTGGESRGGAARGAPLRPRTSGLSPPQGSEEGKGRGGGGSQPPTPSFRHCYFGIICAARCARALRSGSGRCCLCPPLPGDAGARGGGEQGDGLGKGEG